MRKIVLLIASVLLVGLSAFAEDPKKDKEIPVGIMNEDGSVNWVPGALVKKGTTIAIDGYKLPSDARRSLLSNIAGEDLNPKWDKYNTEFWTGLGLLCGGVTGSTICFCWGGVYFMAALIGTVFVAPFGGDAVDEMWSNMSKEAQIPGYISIATSAMTITGVVLMCVGDRGFRKTVNYCNSLGAPQQAYFDFGQTQSGGMGLTFNF
ncbi:MAG: hypothetical protein IKP46_00745 [Bacteroidales bacterium]|nr:hypothetical protein [Bacteroidales bacterium]